MIYAIKMCAIKGGTLHSCLDCRYINNPVGCRLFREFSDSGIVHKKIDSDTAEIAIKRYLGLEV